MPGSPRYALSVAVREGATRSPATRLPADRPDDEEELRRRRQGPDDLPEAGVTKSATGKITAAPGYTVLNARQVNARPDLKTFAVPTADGGGIKAVGLSEAFVGKPTVTYDAATDTITDTATGKTYVAKNATWVTANGNGRACPSGGGRTSASRTTPTPSPTPRCATGFLKILIWNIFFSLFTVLGDVPARVPARPAVQRRPDQAEGAMAVAADPSLRPAGLHDGAGLAVDVQPGLRDHQQLRPRLTSTGSVTRRRPRRRSCSPTCGSASPTCSWSAPARCSRSPGTSRRRPDRRRDRLPGHPLDHHAADAGRGRPAAARLVRLQLQQLHADLPDDQGRSLRGRPTSIGSTDLLITYAYRLAIEGTTPNFGYAAAISVFIFIIVAALSLQGFRKAAALEEVD